jgi:hypothetical protein
MDNFYNRVTILNFFKIISFLSKRNVRTDTLTSAITHPFTLYIFSQKYYKLLTNDERCAVKLNPELLS